MTHGDRFNSTIALSYKPSYVPKSKIDCSEVHKCDSALQIRLHLRHLEASKCRKKNPPSPESWDVQVQLIS